MQKLRGDSAFATPNDTLALHGRRKGCETAVAVLHEVTYVCPAQNPASYPASFAKRGVCALPPLRVRVGVAHAAGWARVLEEVVIGHRTLLVVLQKTKQEITKKNVGVVRYAVEDGQPWETRRTEIT